jgi:hypothetical protein
VLHPYTALDISVRPPARTCHSGTHDFAFDYHSIFRPERPHNSPAASCRVSSGDVADLSEAAVKTSPHGGPWGLIVEKALVRDVMQGKADDDAMHGGSAARLARPLKGAVRKVDFQPAPKQVRPQNPYLFALVN